MSPIKFPQWLQEQLNTRGWDQAKLAQRSGITRGAISHVLNEDRQAGVDFCIAVARALGLPRTEVFKVRGWLPEQSPTLPSETDPRLLKFAEAIGRLPFAERELILNAWEAVLKAAHIEYE